MKRSQLSLRTGRKTRRTERDDVLARYAARQDAVDPATRLAAIFADTELRRQQHTLSPGREIAVREALQGAADELVDQRPYLKRSLDDLLMALDTYLTNGWPVDDSLIAVAPAPVRDVLQYADTGQTGWDEDEEAA